METVEGRGQRRERPDEVRSCLERDSERKKGTKHSREMKIIVYPSSKGIGFCYIEKSCVGVGVYRRVRETKTKNTIG